jgi:lipoprotein-releasing system permease protein
MEDAVHSIRVMTHDPFKAEQVALKIRNELKKDFPDLKVQTWMELNRQLFGALQVEKNMMFFLLIFIVLVAAFGITNTLIIVVVRKTKEIGLLKALGFSSLDVMNVFFWQGTIQGAIGTFLGIVLGIITLHYRNNVMHFIGKITGRDLLPKALYHIGEIPSHLILSDVLLVALLAVFICTLSGIIPAWWSTKLDPAKALRYE